MTQRKITSRSIAANAITSDKIAVGAVTPPTPTAVSDQANSSTGYFDVPAGTTAERPMAPATGMIRYNTTLGNLEQYTSDGWLSIEPPPLISSITPNTFNGNAGSSFTINGSNFKVGCVVKLVSSNGTEYSVGTTTRVSSTQLTITTADDLLVSGEPYSIKVINPSGISGLLPSALDAGSPPTWTTSAGTIATINDAYGSYSPIVTLSATDPDGGSIVYSIESGALPGNVSLNTSTGAISGDPNNISSSTTYEFTVGATDVGSNKTNRTFNIIVNPALDGSSSSRAATSAINVYNFGITSNGYYWLNLDGTPRQFYCDMANGGWILIGHWSQSTTNGGGAAPGSTSYAAAVGGYTGATADAVGAPTTGNDLYNNYGALASGFSGQTGSWAWDAYTRGTNTGGSWYRNSTDSSNGKISCYRPNNYGYSWTQCKYGLRLSAPGGQNSSQYSIYSTNYNSLDGFPSQDRTINTAYVDGISVTTGSSTSRTHQYSYAYDGTATGGNFGVGYGGNLTSYINGNYSRLYTVAGGTASNYDDVSRSFSLGSSTNIPPEFRIISDQESYNEDINVRAFYIFVK